MNNETLPLQNYYQTKYIEAGCDEAGRGCLAGPIFAGAVILDPQTPIDGLNDSKSLSSTKRYKLRPMIEKKALAWSVAMISNLEIDQINIFRASMKAMHLAIDKLTILPEYLIIDGNNFIPYHQIPFTCIVKGDSKYKSIAAASIIAKTYRDDYMNEIHAEHSCYHWNTNKGYATRHHRNAIQQFGISKYHRKSFTLFNNQPCLDL